MTQATVGVRPSNSPPMAIAAALVKAQAAVDCAEKRGKNPEDAYSYATADELVRVGKPAMALYGLAILPMRYTVVEDKHGADLVREFALVHESGAFWSWSARWPIPAGKPRDKALASALTSILGYTYRDTLGIPRVMVGEEPMDQRREAEVFDGESDYPADGERASVLLRKNPSDPRNSGKRPVWAETKPKPTDEERAERAARTQAELDQAAADFAALTERSATDHAPSAGGLPPPHSSPPADGAPSPASAGGRRDSTLESALTTPSQPPAEATSRADGANDKQGEPVASRGQPSPLTSTTPPVTPGSAGHEPGTRGTTGGVTSTDAGEARSRNASPLRNLAEAAVRVGAVDVDAGATVPPGTPASTALPIFLAGSIEGEWQSRAHAWKKRPIVRVKKPRRCAECERGVLHEDARPHAIKPGDECHDGVKPIAGRKNRSAPEGSCCRPCVRSMEQGRDPRAEKAAGAA